MAIRKQKAKHVPKFERPVDQHFYNLNTTFRGNKLAYALAIFGLFFGVMGLIWMIPFPKLAFLERMELDKFLNWGSFFIAIVVYAYLKLAPTLSYAMLFTIGLMSFLIVQLEYVERDGGPSVILVSALIGCISAVTLFVLRKREEVSVSGTDLSKLVTIGPIWLWSIVFDKLKWKY